MLNLKFFFFLENPAPGQLEWTFQAGWPTNSVQSLNENVCANVLNVHLYTGNHFMRRVLQCWSRDTLLRQRHLQTHSYRYKRYC